MNSVPRPTFRDPAGYVEFAGEEVLRRIHPNGAGDALRFLRSTIARKWQASGQMIAGEIEEQNHGVEGNSLLIRHPRIFFPSYPWEWSPAQWRAAAQLTRSAEVLPLRHPC